MFKYSSSEDRLIFDAGLMLLVMSLIIAAGGYIYSFIFSGVGGCMIGYVLRDKMTFIKKKKDKEDPQ